MRLQISEKSHQIDVRRGEENIAKVELPLRYDEVECFTLLDGQHFVVGSNFALYLYFIERQDKLSPLRTFRGHTSLIWAVAPSPDNRWFLTASDDQTVRIWDPEREDPVLSLFVAEDDWVAWTPEGYYSSSPGGDKLIGWLIPHGNDKMPDYYPASRFRKAFYRPDVIRRILECGGLDRALEEADKARGVKSDKIEIARLLPPTVVITQPERSGVKLEGSTTVVRARLISQGKHAITNAQLLVDGRPYKGTGEVRRFQKPILGQDTVEWRIQLLPGSHTLKVLADSEVSQGSDEIINVLQPGVSEGLPQLFVLAVGISDYERPQLRLQHAANDATQLTETFQKASSPRYRKVVPILLTDRKANRAAILKALGQLRKDASARDVVIVFLSAHGKRNEGDRYFLLPSDADPEDLASTCISKDDLNAAIKLVPGRVVLLLDACNSGEVGNKAPPLTDDVIRELKSEESGVITMCSSMPTELSREADGHGHFTRALIEGLNGKARRSATGEIYLSAIDDYVGDRVKQLSNGRQHPVSGKTTGIGPLPIAKP